MPVFVHAYEWDMLSSFSIVLMYSFRNDILIMVNIPQSSSLETADSLSLSTNH